MMRALTLTQPWAGLVASGIKLVENRPRPIIARTAIGSRFAIHASREIDEQVLADLRAHLCECDPREIPASFPVSAILAVATLDNIIGDRIDAARDAACAALPADQHRWFFGPIGYVMRDVIALPRPVTCRGWQGFWTMPPEIERAVMEQLGG